jgi:hypothetical protein
MQDTLKGLIYGCCLGRKIHFLLENNKSIKNIEQFDDLVKMFGQIDKSQFIDSFRVPDMTKCSDDQSIIQTYVKMLIRDVISRKKFHGKDSLENVIPMIIGDSLQSIKKLIGQKKYEQLVSLSYEESFVLGNCLPQEFSTTTYLISAINNLIRRVVTKKNNLIDEIVRNEHTHNEYLFGLMGAVGGAIVGYGGLFLGLELMLNCDESEAGIKPSHFHSNKIIDGIISKSIDDLD